MLSLSGWNISNYRGSKLTFFHVASENEITFTMYLKSFSENYDVGWEDEKTYGRMDNIQKYSNTTRNISLAVDVPAESEEHAKANIMDISTLIKIQYPSYDDGIGNRATAINNPPLLRIKMGNLITKAGTDPLGTAGRTGLLGTIRNLRWAVKEEMGYFNPYPGEFYPRFFDFSFDFKVIHEHPLGWNSNNVENGENFRYFPFNLNPNGQQRVESTAWDTDVATIKYNEEETFYNDAANALENQFSDDFMKKFSNK